LIYKTETPFFKVKVFSNLNGVLIHSTLNFTEIISGSSFIIV